MATHPPILRFDAFELDRDNRQLRKDGQPIELGSRYFDALALLVAHSGDLVTKDAFMETVWHGIPVTDEALTQCVRSLRRALGDDAANPRFIETVPKHGYRFIAAPPRHGRETAETQPSTIAGACTLAGLAAGAVAGLFYGMVAGSGGGGQVLILATMIGALGLLAGAGLGTGMAAAMKWRGRADGWVVAGAGLGGLFVGALGNLLGREGVGLVSGVAVTQVTGPFEGAVLGVAAGCVAWAALKGCARPVVLATAAVSGFVAAAAIFPSGGTLLAGSLQTLEQSLPAAQLSVASIGRLIGEPGLTRAASALALAVEIQIFLLAIGAALLAVRNRPADLT